MAAAIGAGLPVADMVVDIGGGTSEVAVISLGGYRHRLFRESGRRQIRRGNHLLCKEKYNLLIGERTAEEIKISIGSAYPYEDEGSVQIKGRNLVDGLPKNVTISASEVREALADPLVTIVDAIKSTLEKTPRSFPRISSTTALC